MSMPKFVVVEGIDYSGKSTFVEELRRSLVNQGHKVATFAAPSKFGNLRQYIMDNPQLNDFELMCLMSTSMSQTQKEIQQCLDNGFIVICDRWYHSMWVYQARNDFKYFQLFARMIGHLMFPDLLITLDIDYTTYQERSSKRGIQNHLDVMSEELFNSRRTAYSNWYWCGLLPYALAQKCTPISSTFKEGTFLNYCLDYFK